MRSKFGSCAILAGGESKRFHGDKKLIRINGKLLLINIVEQLKKCFNEVLIISDAPLPYCGISVVNDIYKNKGPLGGIHAAVSSSSSEYVFIIACDMPNFNERFIQYMQKEILCTQSDICVAKYGQYAEPFYGFYSKGILPQLEYDIMHDLLSVNKLIDKCKVNYISESKTKCFTPNWSLFHNINTKQSLLDYLQNC